MSANLEITVEKYNKLKEMSKNIELSIMEIDPNNDTEIQLIIESLRELNKKFEK